MNGDIQLKVNLNIFRLMCSVWVVLFVLMTIPGSVLPPELKMLYGVLTGSLLTIFTAFEKKITGEAPPAQPDPPPAQPEE